MKTWKMVFIVFGIFLVLSVISGMAYLCKPQKNAPNMQSDGARHAGWAGQCETQEAGLNSKSQIPNPTLEKEEFAQKTQKLQMPFRPTEGLCVEFHLFVHLAIIGNERHLEFLGFLGECRLV